MTAPEPRPTAPPPTRDWLEDADHENGQYENTCIFCKRKFIGHKRRVCCKLCVAVYRASPLPEEPPPATPNTQEWLCLKCEQKYIGPLSDPRCPTCNSVAEEPSAKEPIGTVPPEKRFEWAVEMYRVAVSNAYWMRGDPSNCDKEAKEEIARAALVALFDRQREEIASLRQQFYETQQSASDEVLALSSQLEAKKDPSQ